MTATPAAPGPKATAIAEALGKAVAGNVALAIQSLLYAFVLMLLIGTTHPKWGWGYGECYLWAFAGRLSVGLARHIVRPTELPCGNPGDHIWSQNGMRSV